MTEKTEFERHILQRFNTDLEHLRTRVLAMGGLVESQITGALAALIGRDVRAAEEVVARDSRVNAMEVAIDKECIHLLALQRPAASDLRMIVAVIKTITDLERIGDEAERIAGLVVQLCAYTLDKGLPCKRIDALGAFVQTMVRDSLNAFARLDSRAAAALRQTDHTADSEYEAITRMLSAYLLKDGHQHEGVLELLWITRALERIGDHATNIGEYTVYLIEGEDIRHTEE